MRCGKSGSFGRNGSKNKKVLRCVFVNAKKNCDGWNKLSRTFWFVLKIR